MIQMNKLGMLVMSLMLVVLMAVTGTSEPTAFNQRQVVDNHDVQKAMLAVCMKEAGILSCVVNVTNANIEITIWRTSDNDAFHKALESIIGNYAWFADKSTYNGDLRIILDNSQGKIIDEWNTTAADAIAHVQDQTIGTGWVESVINASGNQATNSPINDNTISTTKPQGNRYSYDFETLGLDFSTPVGNPVASDNKYTSFISITLADGASMMGEINKLYSWEDSGSTATAAEKLWGASSYDDHSPLTTSRLDNGDYVIYGRYLSGQYMSTKAVRTLDLNKDGQIDYYVVWDGSGKIDQDTITYIASHTSIRTLKPKWD